FNNENFEGDPITSIDPASTHNDVNLYAKWTLITITEIYSTDDLIKFSASVNAGNTYKDKTVKLMNSINFNPQASEDNNFTAIGTKDHPFNGTFEGGNNNGYTISGIRINASTDYQGLFGYVGRNATIQNVTLEDAEITCSVDYVGGIAGENDGKISNCTSSAKVSSSGDDCSYYGGIAGENDGTILYCTSSATVSSSENSCIRYGGIVGCNYGTISNCTSRAKVSSSGTPCFLYGGIAGDNSGTITNNLAIDAVISNEYLYGAIAGSNYYTLTNNYYYNCTVNGVNNATNVGHYYGDIPDNNGAVSVHTITLCDGLSITADPSITYDQTDYYAQGTVLALSYDDGKHFLANNVKIEGTTYTMPAEDVIFSPCYLITYNLNGGTLPEGTDNPTSYTSGTLTLPTPKRDYYTFDGWYQGTTKMTSISGITADVTLTAKWTPVEYSIFYNLNGGALPEGTDNPTTFTVESGEITLPNPTRDGCVFGGWYGNEDFEGDAITTINSADATDFYLYAKWNIQEITEIRTTDDLKKFSASVNAGNDYEGKTVKLMNDIDFNPQTGEDNNFTAIGYDAHPFNGTFDGGNHSISGIRIYDNDGGLFGYLDGTVQDVKLANTKIIAQSVGGIAVFNNGTIKNCSVAKDVIETPYSDNSIVGGIACYNRGTVSNCISSASITDGYMVGGIVAVNFGTIKNNLVIGAAISGKELNGAIIGAIESNDVTIQNNFYYNCTVNGVNNATNVGYYNGDITKNNGAVHLDLIIDGDSESPVAITEAQTGANVLYLRKLKAGVTSTIILPFDFDASSMPGIFYQLTSVNSDDWTAGANKVTGTLSANTPYLFLPNSDIDKTVFTTVTLKPTTNDNSVKIDDHWTFHGVYEKILWEAAPKNHYGFSAVANGDNIAAGDFVRIGKFVRIKPTRAYLTYNGGISKSAIVLPDRIQVIFIDKETASVIDPIDTPTDDPTEDITTPVSELPAQASNVKVWSYEKTIYIQSAPDIDYRIIDATGRVLRSATTQTDRDEIRLGHHSGIVIVIINNKTYKINY
ncbi:MAG: InlB B-repeat-containing protein, partial [Bacteroidales bacterium]|nr:InlB B-repeat-containing protein [Bacteroidales bacterium]